MEAKRGYCAVFVEVEHGECRGCERCDCVSLETKYIFRVWCHLASESGIGTCKRNKMDLILHKQDINSGSSNISRISDNCFHLVIGQLIFPV